MFNYIKILFNCETNIYDCLKLLGCMWYMIISRLQRIFLFLKITISSRTIHYENERILIARHEIRNTVWKSISYQIPEEINWKFYQRYDGAYSFEGAHRVMTEGPAVDRNLPESSHIPRDLVRKPPLISFY